jgi:photosystem II stability/assembly factor-like uncharacterized protein
MTNDDLERDLRRVLADPGRRLPDRLVSLERVHAGAAHRRRQRQAATASLAVLAVVGIGLGVARPWAAGNGDDAITGSSITPPVSSVVHSSPAVSSPSPAVSSSQQPSSSTGPSTSKEVLANVGSVSSVTAIDDRRWWAAASINTCSDCSSTLLSTVNDGKSFSVASHGFDSALGRVLTIRFVDPAHATALVSGGGDSGSGPDLLQSTSDGGRTWQGAPGAAPGTQAGFIALEAGGSQTTYALQQGDDSGIHLWVQVGTTSWKDIATLDQTATPGDQNVQLAVQQTKAVVVWRNATHVVAASYDVKGHTAGPKPIPDCDVTLGLHTLSGGHGAVWLSCSNGTADVILRSTDLGATWQGVPVPGDAGRHVVGAIDANHAMISTANGLGVLRSDETLTDATLPAHVPPHDWTYIGFTNPTHGFALTGSGELLRSSDGGHTWARVTYAG